ncbi:MAG: GreA/GreB family elongation factor [Acidobacteria bacterium]|nr:GreA/GreB family elongation factor [Acidobacteriota bacterium]
MATASVDSLGRADEVSAGGFLVTVPDAERLLLQSRFVKNQVEAGILDELESRIRQATLLDPSTAPPDLVTMNSTVALRDLDTGRQYSFTIVFPSCANWRKGRVSVLTPLGSILLGARTGQTLTCPILGLIATVMVEAILHQPEAAGDYYG